MSRARDIANIGDDVATGEVVTTASPSLGRRNLIINGDFKVSQRGDYSSATTMSNNAYYLDRFKVSLNSVTGTIQHLSDQLVNGSYVNTCKISATSSATGIIGARQQMEEFYKGQTVTFSAWVKSNSPNARLSVYDGTGSTFSNAHTGSGEFEFLTLTRTISTSVSQLACWFYIIGASGSTVSISSGDYIEVTQVQLEVGSVATPFEHRSYGEELALCQRYFYKYPNGQTWGYQTIDLGSGYARTKCFFPQTMRATPTMGGITYSTSSGAVGVQFTTTDATTLFANPSLSGTGQFGGNWTADAEL